MPSKQGNRRPDPRPAPTFVMCSDYSYSGNTDTRIMVQSGSKINLSSNRSENSQIVI